MDFLVLGPLAVVGDEDLVDLGGPRQRRLLAALVASRNEVVSTDRLIDIVFEGEPTPGASTTIRSYVARLRKALNGGGGGADELIVTEAPGYVLRLGPDDLDADRFTNAVDGGREELAGGDARGAVDALREALAMWRGPAFDGLAFEEWLQAEVAGLDERRVVAEESLIDALLESGLATDAVTRLYELIDEYPLRDRFRAQLMLALYRTGRQAEALRSFQDYRQLLIDVALEPSEELAALDRAIVVQDPALQLAAPVGRPLRGYRLSDEIGSGSHGVVYRAVQPGVGREVAVKMIRPELADDPGFIRRFDAEAQLVSRLQHPNIVPLHDFWREPGGAYLVMRLLPGDLSDHLAGGPMGVAQVRRLAGQVGSALMAAHRTGVVHGDVKPSNVLVDHEKNGYLADFGVATLVADEGAPPPSARSGHESPERLGGDPATPASDQFALAVVLTQALTGLLPFGRQAISSPHDRLESVHLHRPSVPLAVDDVLSQATAWDPHDRYRDVDAFIDELTVALGGPKPSHSSLAEPTNPYKGLRAFTEADAEEFFGRSDVVDDLVVRLASVDGSSRFVALVGASGSGKSSIVRAGLIPRLRQDAIPKSNEWFIATMTPGPQPFAALEAALRAISRTESDGPIGGGSLEPETVTSILHAAVPDRAPVLLVIDQLEELFTLVTDDTLRATFLDGLSGAVGDPASNLRVVATLRADFYDQPLQYHRIGELIRTGTVAIAALSAAELELAIRGPATRSGVEIEPALTTELVADVVDQPAALPLLQFTLTELFARREGRLMTLRSYRELGGVDAAVAERADQVHQSLSSTDQELSRRLFLRLISIGPNETPTRRRALRSDLMSVSGDGDDVGPVIDAYGHARLLTFDRDPDSREPTVEVAHESLITHWPRLTGWVADAGDGLRVQAHLSDAASSWALQGRDLGDLYRGARLEMAVRLRGQPDAALTPLEDEFLTASSAQRERESAAEREQSERRVRANRRLKGTLAGVGVALVVALVAGFAAVDQRDKARDESARADEEARIATVGRLAAASEANLDTDPELSTLLALEALEVSGPDVDPAAEQALHESLLSSRLLATVPNGGNGIAHFSPDGTLFLDQAEDLDAVDVWTVDPVRHHVTLRGEGGITDAVFSPDSTTIATTDERGVTLWDADTGAEIRTFPGVGAFIPSFSNDGSLVAASTVGPTTLVWDVATGELRWTLQDPEPRAVAFNLAFSPDDSTLAVTYGSSGGAPAAEIGGIAGHAMWDLETGQQLRRENGLNHDVGFSPDGGEIYTSNIALVDVWDAATGERTGRFDGHESPVIDLHVAADTGLVASSASPEVLVWDPTSFAVVAELVGHTGEVDGVDITADGSRVITSSGSDRTTRLWDANPYWRHELASFPGQDFGAGGNRPAGAVAFGADSSVLAATGPDGTITIWDPTTGQLTETLQGPGAHTFALAFSADHGRLAAAGVDGLVIHELDGDHDAVRPIQGAETITVGFHPTDGAILTAGQLGVGVHRPTSADVDKTITELQATGAVYSPDGAMIALARTNDTDTAVVVEVFDTATGELIAQPPVGRIAGDTTPDAGAVRQLAFSPDSRLLAAAESDGFTLLWDTDEFDVVHRLEGHTAAVFNVAFDPTRPEVATASLDATIRIWDTRTGKTRLVLPEPGAVSGLAYSPDGRYLATANVKAPPERGAVTVYMLDVDELVEEAQRRITRDFTEAECRRYLEHRDC